MVVEWQSAMPDDLVSANPHTDSGLFKALLVRTPPPQDDLDFKKRVRAIYVW